MEQDLQAVNKVRRVKKQSDEQPSAMNALALRIWDGQSTDLPLNERVRRIVAGLKAQGHEDFDSLSLPAEGFRQYLK